MNDMIGCTGMLRGWTILWQTELTWLLPTFVMVIGVVALMESVIRSRTLRASLSRLLHDGMPASTALVVGLLSPKPLANGSSVASGADILH